MRTRLDLPDGLVEEARSLLGCKSKTDTVVLSLKKVIRVRGGGEITSPCVAGLGFITLYWS
ncbi:MAG TPA: type II toxin-antitoxin system VapB family antitoxin [Terriglobales bacterium]|jgi:hypothetical protein